MKFVYMLLLCIPAIFIFGCTKKEDAKETQSYEGIIVAAGNSLTAGFSVSEDEAYPALLQKKLLKEGYRYKVINAGVSGETSSGLLSRINWILKMNPDIVILETGANDGFRGLDTKLMKKNIEESVRILKSKKVTVVLAGMQMVRNLGKEYTTAFNDVYPVVAKEEGVILMPFFLEGVAGNQELNSPDGIHPTAKGYEIVAEKIYPYVVEAIKKERAAR